MRQRSGAADELARSMRSIKRARCSGDGILADSSELRTAAAMDWHRAISSAQL
jgi:hypothetical protein